MKLEWMRAGCASIAECGEYTAVILYDDNKVEHRWMILTKTGASLHAGTVRSNDCRDAELEVTDMLDQHDRPVWHDVTEWLSWAEWRGKQITVFSGVDKFGWYWNIPDGPCQQAVHSVNARDAAKAAAEKYVREQTAKGESC